MSRIALVRTTFGDRARAEQVARALIDERLVACATLEQVHSIYRWQGTVEQADEAAVLFKARPEDAYDLLARITELHDYDVPVIEYWTVDANPPAKDWVNEATAR